jgi:hypothetical protein
MARSHFTPHRALALVKLRTLEFLDVVGDAVTPLSLMLLDPVDFFLIDAVRIVDEPGRIRQGEH